MMTRNAPSSEFTGRLLTNCHHELVLYGVIWRSELVPWSATK